MRLIDIYEQLLEILGHQNWWPADTPFEVVVGALLTQQTRWSNVEQAISNLKERGLLEPENLAVVDTDSLEELIRCTGFYRQKARRLKNLAAYYSRNKYTLSDKPVDELRLELLGLEGVGDETADSIILYAINKPKFVIDAYTCRILDCLGLDGNYRVLQQRFESELEHDVDLFKEYHALIVEYGKQYCSRHKCEYCVLIKNGKTII
ncbi:MAG: Endonuclease III [Candidatus Methanocomedens sp.]|nr:MAG: Endonuclease III [ANME-2 cluster archaeon]